MYRKIFVDKQTLDNICSSYESTLEKELLDYYDTKKKIEDFKRTISGNINAENIWNTFFPEIDTTVFISHSGKDIQLAHRFANYLYQKFSIHSFVDYDVWKYFKKVLAFVYGDNVSIDICANLYAILSYSLTRMIEHCDLFCFLGTKNSICECNVDRIITNSPWIFHELTVSNTLEVRTPAYISEEVFLSETEFPVILKKFFEMKTEEFKEWEQVVATDKINEFSLEHLLSDISDEQRTLEKLFTIIDNCKH